MSDTENTKTTPKEKKPTLSVTYVKQLSFLFNALDGEDPDLKHRIMEKMSTFAPVEEQIDFFNDLCSNENWKVLQKDYKTYVKENEKAAKSAETEDDTSKVEAASSITSNIVVEEEATAPVETSSEEKPKKKKGGKKKKSEETISDEVSA